MRSITSSDQFRVRDAQGKQATLFVSPVTEYDDWVFCTLVQDSVIGRSTHQIDVYKRQAGNGPRQSDTDDE